MSSAQPLPVAWDGAPVTWTPWEPDRAFLCPPSRPVPCVECGLIRPVAMCTGTIATRFRNWRLRATRCTGCGHDTVYDHRTGTTWDLDMTDYGPDGSWSVSPRGRAS